MAEWKVSAEGSPGEETGGKSLVQRIREHFRDRIVAGEYAVGARLPTVRHVAEEVRTTPQTVAAAYRLLSDDGLVATRTRGGTVVLSRPAPVLNTMASPATSRSALIPSLTRPSHHETYRRLLQLDRDAKEATFASYFLPADFSPTGLGEQLRSLWRQYGESLMDPGAPEGDPRLRAIIKAHVDPTSPDFRDVVVTNGAQEGLALAFRALVSPGDAVVVENPTYLGALELLSSLGAEIHGVEMRADGPDLDALQQAFARARPKFFYTMPSSHNPTGYAISPRNRRRLLALAYRYDCHIVEDAANARISYSQQASPSLLELDERGVVLQVGSFSKTLWSGVRAGYLVARSDLLPFLTRLKWLTDVHTPLLQQRLVHQFLIGQRYARHLSRVTQNCIERRDAMLQALAREMAGRATWVVPGGGFSIWVSLRGDVDAAQLFEKAIERGVSFVPGAVFYASDVQHNTLRLCFSSSPPDVISRGITLLRAALDDLTKVGSKTNMYYRVSI